MKTSAFLMHHGPATESFFMEGGFITEWWNSPHDAKVSIAPLRVKPGVTPRWPRLRGVTERSLIREGWGRVEGGGRLPEAVGPGAIILIPPGVRQRITPLGRVDRVFLAVCTPHFTRAGDEDLAVD